MNQDQIKEKLIQLYDLKHDFSVIFSGKKSKTVNGKYLSDSKEIVLNNKNFQNDNLLIYTAIHELAHHVVLTELEIEEGHTTLFWATFHNLLSTAEQKGFYKCESSPKLSALVAEVKEIDRKIASLTEKLGELLSKTKELCDEEGIRFEDVVDRDLRIKRTTAKKAMRISAAGMPENIGSDEQAAIMALSSTNEQEKAIVEIQEGKTIDQVKQDLKKPKERDIEKEKHRIEKTITMLTIRLEEIEQEISGREEISA